MNDTVSPATAPASDGSVDSAAKRILAAMDGPKAKTEPASSDADTASPPNQSDEVGDGSDTEVLASDEAAPEAELADGDTEQDTEAEATDEGGPPPLSDEDMQRIVTVKVNGEMVQVPLEEALKGYSRTSDYYQKTQALAEERKAVHREVEEAAKERQVYASIIPAMVAKLQSEMPSPPSQELRYADPAQYLLQMEDYRMKQEALRALQSEQMEVQRRERMREEAEFKNAVAEGYEKLPELWPEWKDKVKYERDVKAMWSYAKKTYGYGDDELSMTTDPRAVAILNKARLYDELRAKKIVPDPRIERVMKPTGGTSVDGTQMSNRAKQLGQTRTRLRETGRVEDAAKAIGLLFRD
jgi:hypothetical protein